MSFQEGVKIVNVLCKSGTGREPVTGKMPVPQCHRQDACTTMSQARCLYHNVTGKMPVPQYILNNYLTKYMSFQEGVKIVNVL
jgi:hypothetical protein